MIARAFVDKVQAGAVLRARMPWVPDPAYPLIVEFRTVPVSSGREFWMYETDADTQLCTYMDTHHAELCR